MNFFVALILYLENSVIPSVETCNRKVQFFGFNDKFWSGQFNIEFNSFIWLGLPFSIYQKGIIALDFFEFLQIGN